MASDRWWAEEVSVQEIAFHECGHAVVGTAGGRKVIRLSIEKGISEEGIEFFGECRYDREVIPDWRSRARESVAGAIGQCLFRHADDELCRALSFGMVDGLILTADGMGGAQDRNNLFAALNDGGTPAPPDNDASDHQWIRQYVKPIVNECTEILLGKRQELFRLAKALLEERTLHEETFRVLLD